MILDSSAIIAVLIQEPGCEALEWRMSEARAIAVGAPTLFETAMVMTRAGIGPGQTLLSSFRADMGVTVVSFEVQHAEVARDAFERFGRGRHPAKLNYGDCMTYATARVADEPLLFIGNDFAQTDIRAA